jgi:cation-transporting ATPase 13A3/4/5
MPTWDIEPYNSAIMHNVLPKYFRWQLWGFLVANCATTAIWERVIVQWIGRKWAIKKFGAKHNEKRVTLKL